MSNFREFKNPFFVQSPERLSAQDAHSLFVDVFTDFPKILTPGHTFLHGPRGSGKSMMFRYLLPDCLSIKHGNKLSKLPFFAIWVKLKNTDLKITDLMRLEDKHASSIINEHLLVIQFTEIVFDTIIEHAISQGDFILDEVRDFMQNVFINRLECGGWKTESTDCIDDSVEACFESMKKICRIINSDTLSYIRRLPFAKEIPPYQGPLFGYLDFLHPILCGLRKLSSMPNGPIFLLLDDADNLNITQTKILNSWVYTRTQADVSIKISTQMRYKTYKTINGQSIQTPHDFSETNISTIYTSSAKDKYPERVKKIIEKRLKLFDIDIEPEDFFPPDETQEAAIKKIYDSYKNDDNPKGYRSDDDAYRYARPDYMKQLGGSSKSKSSYSYSGFKQLVDISSGIIRFFLEPASKMYSKMIARNHGKPIENISSGIQNQVIRDYSDDFMFLERERLQNEEGVSLEKLELIEMLFNFIDVLGGTFSQILLSDRSERRVISMVFYERPTKKLQEIIHSGLEYGYLHVSTIGNKEGTGRLRQYVLSRRLAPYYYLDPTGFSGYLFVAEEQVWEAISHPSRMLRRIREKGVDEVFKEDKTLFDL